MTEDECEELDVAVQPVRVVLVKLRKLAYAIKNSTMLILPQWWSLLDQLKLRPRMMPRDVATRWNSTYDMLVFALDYKPMLNSLTDMRAMKLEKYDMQDNEWEIAAQL
ncbi:hypothetical protein Hypma_000607 [Hypsizygus marmoreus]|uniref:Uncharacterized protein n=1 Tax=Hypsizygus marmoreus TaxID=39966 RepID=A0A369J8H4_HYPMA|nr:hypothetical protein Hypma_000607 [Hypsizygus marmoreus]